MSLSFAHAQLTSIIFPSIYKVNGSRVPVPERMAHCTADTQQALVDLQAALKDEHPASVLQLSDLFRSHDMQLQAHLDYVSGKKRAYSPPPGSSMHEAGRAFDVDLGALITNGLTLRDFWVFAEQFGIVPIITKPSVRESEAWHFEVRGSHQMVYDHYNVLSETSKINMKPYAAMVTSALLDVNIPTVLSTNSEIIDVAHLQSALIRLETKKNGRSTCGVIDGLIGPKTRRSYVAVSGDTEGATDSYLDVERVLVKLRDEFPEEWFPKHLSTHTMFA